MLDLLLISGIALIVLAANSQMKKVERKAKRKMCSSPKAAVPWGELKVQDEVLSMDALPSGFAFRVETRIMRGNVLTGYRIKPLNAVLTVFHLSSEARLTVGAAYKVEELNDEKMGLRRISILQHLAA